MTTTPICKVCGAEISRLPGDHLYKWKARKVCRPETDTKERKCLDIIIHSPKPAKGSKPKVRRLNRDYRKMELPRPKPRKVMPQEEIDRLEAEQREINRQIDAALDRRHGVTSLTCRSLDKTEIRRLEQQYTPQATVFYFIPKGVTI